jgi:hypothetical protein
MRFKVGTILAGFCAVIILLRYGTAFANELQSEVAGLSRDTVQRLRERIYRDGYCILKPDEKGPHEPAGNHAGLHLHYLSIPTAAGREPVFKLCQGLVV